MLKDSDTNYGTDYNIKIPNEQMLISGKAVGDSAGDGSCYLAVFGPSYGFSEVMRNDTWILGNVAIQNYYLVFD